MNSYRLIESAWTLSIIAFVVIVTWTLLGCASQPQCIKPIVTLERPVLPTVSAAELACLSDEAYLDIATRDLLLHQAFEQCKLIVDELAEVPK